MSRRRQTAGVERILQRLEKNVEEGNYYDAFQMYNSVYNRIMGERKVDDGLTLLVSGCTLFLSHRQESSGTELAMLLGEHMISNHTTPSASLTETLIKIIKSFEQSNEGRQRFIAKVFKWSKMYTDNGDPKIHKACAEIYLAESDYATCCTHCVYLDLDGVVFYTQTLIHVSLTCTYQSELALVITWAVLQFLTMKRTEHARRLFNTYTVQHPNITTKFPFEQPLLNFLHLFLQAIDRRKPELVKLLRDKYEKCLSRDPYFQQCTEKILFVYFNERRHNPTAGLGGIMQSLLGGLAPMEDIVPGTVVDADEELD